MSTPARRVVRRLLVIILAGAWLALGFLSDSVPWFSEPTWIVLCSIAAGSALALARYTTMYSLRRYVIIATLVGVLRSAAYGLNGAYGPMCVWLILLSTTIAAALTLHAQSVTR
jgi:hypothetical protein